MSRMLRSGYQFSPRVTSRAMAAPDAGVVEIDGAEAGPDLEHAEATA